MLRRNLSDEQTEIDYTGTVKMALFSKDCDLNITATVGMDMTV